MTRIYDVSYKGFPGICMENDALKAIFLPTQGAKLCSLTDRKSGKEFIYQGKTQTYQPSVYGGSYLAGECAGIDECLPNIDACYYDTFPWSGTPLPDHGEVWALPWDMVQEKNAVSFQVHGVRLPYRLEKHVSLHEKTLRMDYTLTNLSDFRMDYIWAAHMMLQAQAGCRFHLPQELSTAYVTMSASGSIGRYGDTFQYPGTAGYDFSTYRGDTADDYQKIYFADKLPVHSGWAEISYPDGARFRIRFPAEQIPYLGIIEAEGSELDIRCMFLEPCSGTFDRPDIAKLHGQCSFLTPKQVRSWYLEIQL